MTIKQMMTAIEAIHPTATVFQPGKGWSWRVQVDGKDLAVCGEQYEAVLTAYKAVKQTEPRPMTVAQCKEAVIQKHPKVWSGQVDVSTDGGPRWFIWEVGRQAPLARGNTEGQAWKAAALAIQAEEPTP